MLSFTILPGKQLVDNEKLDNDKFNLGARPTLEIDGGLDAYQAEFGPWFVAVDASSVVNAYVGQLTEVEQDFEGSPIDGLVVAFKVPLTLTNTGASTFELKSSVGVTLVSATAVQRRGRAVLAGELVAGRYLELRWDGTVWELLAGEGFDNPAEFIPATVWWGTDDASTGTAYAMRFTPAPVGLSAGMRVTFAVPVTSSGVVTLQLKDGSGTNIGGAVQLNRVNSGGTVTAIGAGDLKSGAVVELVYTGSSWQLISDVVEDYPQRLTNLVAKLNAVTPNTQVDFSADEAVVQNPSGGSVVLNGVSVTGVDIAVNGANGLDTGSAANSTWYYVWVIYNATSVTVAGLLSTSATAPAMPSGYSHKARIGAVYRDSGGAFVPFFQTGNKVYVRPTEIFTGKNPAAPNTYEALAGADLTAFRAIVPPIARLCAGIMGTTVVASGFAFGVAGDSNGMGVVFAQVEQTTNLTLDGVTEARNFEVPVIDSPVNIYWKGGTSMVLRIVGWSY